jgi:LuxR family maltose regulon positive regulatory protein
MATPAKFAAPRPRNACKRERLFAWLDRGREGAGIWISGPPGAGKTTLIATYVDARDLACFWYNVDRGDADVASFFYNLGIAARQFAPRRKQPLPLFTPEHARGVAAFSRGFFREFFSRLGAPCVLILDNYQDATEASQIHDALSEGWAEIPQGVCVVALSRSDPPPQLACRRANQLLQCLTWDELKFDDDEVRDLVRSRAPNVTEISLEALGRADGWAAGLILLLESRDKSGSAMPQGAPPQVLFDYFADQVFNRVEQGARNFLLTTAFLTRFSAGMAEALTTHRGAERVLAYLARYNLFTTRYGEYFQYHPLFRQFLLARARESFPADRLMAVRNDAARLLDSSSMVEDAIDLWLESQDWDAVAMATKEQAPALLTQGRHAVVTRWLDALPSEVVATDPWLLYWRAAARLPFAPIQSQPWFEHAHEVFYKQNDRAGLFLSWAGAVEAVRLGRSDAGAFDQLIARLDELLFEDANFPSEAIEFQVAHGMYAALFVRQPQHPEFERWKERALALARSGPDQPRRAYTVYMTIIFELMLGHPAEARFLLDSLAAQDLRDAPSIVQNISYFARAYFQREVGMAAACIETAKQGLQASASSGVHSWDFHIRTQGVVAALSIGDLECTDALLEAMARATDLKQPGTASVYHMLVAAGHLRRADPKSALPHVEASVRLPGVGLFFLAFAHIALSSTLWQLENPDRAKEELQHAFDVARTMKSACLLQVGWMIQARFALDEGDRRDAVAALRKGLPLGHENELLAALWNIFWRPQEFAPLYALALQEGIETEYVHRLIRLHRIVAPASHVRNWPWPIEIRTLGSFEILRNGDSLQFERKTPKRTLQLLKTLIAFGGRDVTQERIADTLWPDSSGDEGINALNTTVSRLRALLDEPDSIIQSGGHLTINTDLCCVDAFVFEKVTDGLIDGGQMQQPHIERALELYRGSFLDSEPDAPWAVSMRERLRRKFVLAINRQAQLHELSENTGLAVHLYLRGIDGDELAEEFYRGLMRCYEKLGRRAEAMGVFRQLRQTLSVTLGIGPSKESQALFESLRSEQPLARS